MHIKYWNTHIFVLPYVAIFFAFFLTVIFFHKNALMVKLLFFFPTLYFLYPRAFNEQNIGFLTTQSNTWRQIFMFEAAIFW